MAEDETEVTEAQWTDVPVEGNGDAPPPVQALGTQGPFSGVSVVDLFQAEQAELAATKSVFIAMKGYEKTGLQIKYRMPESGKELELLGQRITRQQKDTYSRNLYLAMDTIITLCEGLYVQPEGVPEPVPLDPDNVGEPCQFDTTLAALLGMNVVDGQVTAREVLKKLFGGNELAIMTHAFDLNRWLQNTKADLSLEMWQVGE